MRKLKIENAKWKMENKIKKMLPSTFEGVFFDNNVGQNAAQMQRVQRLPRLEEVTRR